MRALTNCCAWPGCSANNGAEALGRCVCHSLHHHNQILWTMAVRTFIAHTGQNNTAPSTSSLRKPGIRNVLGGPGRPERRVVLASIPCKTTASSIPESLPFDFPPRCLNFWSLIKQPTKILELFEAPFRRTCLIYTQSKLTQINGNTAGAAGFVSFVVRCKRSRHSRNIVDTHMCSIGDRRCRDTAL